MQPLFISKISSSALDDEILIDADFAELVFDDGDALAVRGGEDVVEQRGFACAEEAGEDSDGNALVGALRSGGHGNLGGAIGHAI